MISCKIECIYNEHGECSKEDIVMGLSGCLSMIERDDSTYAKVIAHHGAGNQTQKTIEELNEFADALMGYGDIEEEMADTLNMIWQNKRMYRICNEDLHNIMAQKMQRELERIQGEQGQ